MPQTEEHLDILHLLGVAPRHLRDHQGRPGRRGAARGGARGDRDPGARHDARGRAGGRRVDRRPARGSTRCARRSRRSSRGSGARRRRRLLPPARRPRLRHARPRRRGDRHGDRRRRSRAGDAVRVLPGGETARVRGARGARRGRSREAERGPARRAQPRRASSATDVARGARRLRPAPRRASPTASTRGSSSGPRRGRPLASHARVRVHLGTAEVLGKRRACSTARRRWRRGSAGWAQLVLREPVLALRGDRFILRDETAQRTLGGGVVVNPFADRHRRGEPALVAPPRARCTPAATADAVARRSSSSTPEFASRRATTLAQALRPARRGGGRRRSRAMPTSSRSPTRRTPEAYTTAREVERARERRCVERRRGAPPRRAARARARDGERCAARLPWDRAAEASSAGASTGWSPPGAWSATSSVVRLPAHRVALGAQRASASATRVERLLAAGGFTPPDLRQLGRGDRHAGRGELVEVLARARAGGPRGARSRPICSTRARAADEAPRCSATHCRAHGEITAAHVPRPDRRQPQVRHRRSSTGATAPASRVRVGDVRKLRR